MRKALAAAPSADVAMFSGMMRTAVFLCLMAVVAAGYLSNKSSQPRVSQATSTPGSVAASQVTALPVAASPAGYGTVELRADASGQYHADVDIENSRIPMLVDTGATLVALTFEDAARLGLAPAPADYTVDVHTANGVAKAARVTLREVRLGTLRVAQVSALVMPRGIVGTSLLGMSFLRKLGGFQVAEGNLLLRP
jgi:aspartyl protease family protein